MTDSEKQAQDEAAHAADTMNGAADVQPTLDEDAAPASSSAAKGESVTLEGYQTLQAQAQQYLDGWQRERAEFANFQRRSERDLKASYQNATGDAFKAVLPVLDDFERAMSNVPADLGANPWVNGVGMILRKFYTVFENNNVTIVDPTGQPFNPAQHEAIGMDDNPEVESGMITATVQKGYLYGDRVLRPALVRVAR